MTAQSQDPIREAARAVVYLLWENTAHSSDTEATERAEEVLRSALPELSDLLGELAVKTAAVESSLEALCWASGSPPFETGGEAREGWLRLGKPAIDAGHSAMSSDSGRLAAELIRAAVRLRDDLKERDIDPFIADKGPAGRFEATVDALLARFPSIR